MKHAFVLLALVATLGCASSQDEGPAVAVRIAPIDTSSDLFTYRGPIVLRYAVEVSNPTDQPITLRRLDLRTAGTGPYTLNSGSTPMNVQVAANAMGTFSIQTYGRSRGSLVGATEPVTIQGKAYFDSPKGPFVRIFQENILPGN
jgi:hypothetical protein